MTTAPPRAPVGTARDVREHLGGGRRPLLVSFYAALLSESGVFGPAVRRRTLFAFVRALPGVIAVGIAALVAARTFVAERGGWPQGGALVTLLAAVLWVSWRRARRAGEGRRASVREQLEIGALFLAASFAVAQTSESPASPGDGPLFPIVYLVLAFLVASFQRRVGASLGLSAVALDAACWWSRGARVVELPTLAAHAAFLLLFAVLFHAVLAARLGAARRAERAAVSRRMRDIEQRAREFRLLAPGAGADDEDSERRAREAAVVEVESALRGACGVAAAALRARSAAVFTISDDDRELVLREWASPVAPARSIPAGEGPLAAVVQARTPVRLDGDIAANWCDGGPRPHAMLAVPLLERRGHVRGVLLVDRIDPQPFTHEDERLLATVGSEIHRAMDSERLMSDLKRARDEKERFYQALERLNRTSKAREVCDALLEIARGMATVEFGAVTLTDDRSGALRHRIVRLAAGEHAGSGAVEGAEFEDGKGLVASSVRLSASLPGVDLDISKTPVFDESTRLKGLGSLKVLPLKTGDQVLGTLVVGAERRGAYDREAVRQLEAVAMQAAEAILRARLFDETERLATTDGLTGLLNHRTFQARLDEHVAAAVRYSKKLSFLITDVDHFKKVNDTYGHPAGDEVLRGVAKILAREARSTDLVARYGGEEFAIVMPETDAAGALVIAERIREKVAAAVFSTGAGMLRASISIGVATIPDDARAKARLVELADAALYRAKRGGRNRTVAAGQREAA
ncbi:MAG TPA: sensor domain-containing diguanylate cyclase [Anaeromyxobacteraceae bacterium]|nr:sensor domain-containing diguanylate cyclase [Anaeromyxobacteraceae bacterium]